MSSDLSFQSDKYEDIKWVRGLNLSFNKSNWIEIQRCQNLKSTLSKCLFNSNIWSKSENIHELNPVGWGAPLHSASRELSQSTVDQRQMDQLSVLVVQQHCELWFPGLNRQERHMKVVRCLQKKVSSMFALVLSLDHSWAEVMKTCVSCRLNWPRCKKFTHSHRTQKPDISRFKWDFGPVEKGYHKAF